MRQNAVAAMFDQAMTVLTDKGFPPKALASKVCYSVDSLYKVVTAGRAIPTQARQKLAGENLLFGLAVALEGTDYRVFDRPEGDRHIQSVLQHVMIEDEEADVAVKSLPRILLDARGPGDLTPDARKFLEKAAHEVCEDIRWKFELLVNLEAQFGLDIIQKCLLQKEKTTCAATRAAHG